MGREKKRKEKEKEREGELSRLDYIQFPLPSPLFIPPPFFLSVLLSVASYT